MKGIGTLPASTDTSFDIAIVGGGLAGASLAVALDGLPLSIALIEAFAPDSQAQPSFDERTTALGNASRRIFEGLGLWARLAPDAAPISSIHVSDAGRFGFARLDARQFDQDALGYVVPNRVLGRELWGRLANATRVTSFMPARVTALDVDESAARIRLEQQGVASTLQARLVVAAESAPHLRIGPLPDPAGFGFVVVLGVSVPITEPSGPPVEESVVQLHSLASITGVVVGPDGAALPGVEVHSSLTRQQTTTDAAGRFALRGLPHPTTLTISRGSRSTSFEVPDDPTGLRIVLPSHEGS